MNRSREDLLEWAGSSAAFFGLDLSRISTALLAQMRATQESRTYSTFDLTAPIKWLEDPARSQCRTKGATPFKHDQLKGLQKVHFNSPRHLPRNLLEAMNRHGDSLVGQTWRKAQVELDPEADAEALVAYVVHKSTMLALEERNRTKAMTGEWIVFREYQGKNYYLSLAAHDEGDAVIQQRILAIYASDDFPFKAQCGP